VAGQDMLDALSQEQAVTPDHTDLILAGHSAPSSRYCEQREDACSHHTAEDGQQVHRRLPSPARRGRVGNMFVAPTRAHYPAMDYLAHSALSVGRVSWVVVHEQERDHADTAGYDHEARIELGPLLEHQDQADDEDHRTRCTEPGNLRAHDAGYTSPAARHQRNATIDLTDVMAEEVERRGIDQVFAVTHYSSLGDRVVVEHLMQTLPSMVSTTCGPG